MTVLRAELRELDDSDRDVVQAWVRADPVGQCVFDARMARAAALTAFDLGGHLWGVDRHDRDGVEAACFAGGNLMPLGGSADGLRAIGEQLGQRPRTWSSIVGHQADVTALWSAVGEGWGRPRSMRMDQPLLLSTEVGPLPPNQACSEPDVRPAEAPAGARPCRFFPGPSSRLLRSRSTSIA